MLPVQRGQRRREGDGKCPRIPPPVGVLLPPEAPVGGPVRWGRGRGPGGDRRLFRPADRKGGPCIGARRRRGGEREQRVLPSPFRPADRPPGFTRQRGCLLYTSPSPRD